MGRPRVPVGDGRRKNWEDGTAWNDDYPRWYGNVGTKDGFTSVMSMILTKPMLLEVLGMRG